MLKRMNVLGLGILISAVACVQKFPAAKKDFGVEARTKSQLTSKIIEKIGELPHQGIEPRAIDFVNAQDGWIAEKGNLWHTRDGGKSWSLIYSIASEHDFIYGMQFVNPQVGWMSWGDGVYKTEDSGRTWTELLPGKELVIFDLLSDGKRGWIAGGISKARTQTTMENLDTDTYNPKHLAIFYTEDGGVSWKQQPIEQEEGNISKIFSLDAEHGWAFSDNNVFYLKDGKWKKVILSGKCKDQNFTEGLGHPKGMPRFGPVSIFFADADTGWLSFSSGDMAWSLTKSTDGGITWCDVAPLGSQESTFPAFFEKLYFSSRTDGWGLDSYGALFETKDGGISWAKIESEIQFLDIDFIDGRHGWAITKEGLFRIR